MNIKKIFGNISLFLLSILVALLIGEIVLRAFYKDSIPITPRYHTDAQYGEYTLRRLRPNSEFWHTTIDGSWKFVINAQGFRNEKDFSHEKPAGTLRVLSIGDSHTEGFEVRQEQTFSAVIERYLNGEGISTEVINAGVSGFSTAEALIFLENEGIKYKPDVVILGFYANDLKDNIKAGIFTVDGEQLIIKNKEHIPGVRILNIINGLGLFRWLSENSYVYSFGFNSAWNVAKRLLLGKKRAKLQTEYAVPVDKVSAYQKKLAGKIIERAYRFCQQNNIKLIILDLPKISKGSEIQSSVPPGLLELMQINSDVFMYSKEVLHPYRNVADFHVPHGSRHISELTHMILGIEVGRTVLQWQDSTAVVTSSSSNEQHN